GGHAARPAERQPLPVWRVAPIGGVHDAVRAGDREVAGHATVALELPPGKDATLDSGPGLRLAGKGATVGRGAEKGAGAGLEETVRVKRHFQALHRSDVEKDGLAQPRVVDTGNNQWTI